MKLRYKNDKVLLGLLCIFFLVVYMFSYPQHAFYGDENSYLILGQKILEGRYIHGIFDRAPMLPLMVSVPYAIGLDTFQIKFILPLIIGLLFIYSTFLLAKRICKRPFIPVMIVLSFPFFWQWAPFVLVDVLLGVFSTLSALYLYKGIEDDRRYLTYSILFLSLAILTKISAIVLIPAFLLYLIIRKRLYILKDRYFLRGLAFFLVILIPVTVLTFLSSGTLGFRFMSISSYFRIPLYYLLNFALVPWSLLFLYGAYKTLRDRNDNSYIFSLTVFLIIFALFNLLVWKEMRFLIFSLPLFAVVAEKSLSNLSRKTAYALASIFFAAGFIFSMLLLNTVSYVTWGGDILIREMLALPENSSIVYDACIPYNKDIRSHAVEMPINATGEWITNSSADYIFLSLYGELKREPNMSYYKPMLGPIDISFLETGDPKWILTWWPGYKFNSELYQWVNSNLPVYKKVQFKGQDVFIIYKVI